MTPAARALALTLAMRGIYSAAAALVPGGYHIGRSVLISNYSGLNAMAPSWDWPYLVYGVWERFDTQWYLEIAASGYQSAQATVFYPLYPFLIRCLSPIFNISILAALVISSMASFFVFWGLQKLFLLDQQPQTVMRAILFLAVWPASFILFAAYPDSLVISFIVWGLLWAREGKWWLAGLLGFLAGVTKATGILICIPLLILMVQTRAWRKIPALALAASGALLYQLWIRLSGFPSANDVYSAFWSTKVSLPWDTLAAAIRQVSTGNLVLKLNLAAIAVIVLSIFVAWPAGVRRIEYIAYLAAAVCMFLMKQTDPILQSSLRYLLVAFPVFLVCAKTLNWGPAAALTGVGLFAVNLLLLSSFAGWNLVV